MAQPIGVTPILRGKEATEFLAMIQRDLEKPVGLIPTPKLGKARELIKRQIGIDNRPGLP